MKLLFNIFFSIFFLLSASSCHYHYGPEENLNGENPESGIQHKSYVKSNAPKTRSIQDIEMDIAALKVNLDLVSENLANSDKDHATQVTALRAEIHQMEINLDNEITKIYWIIAGTAIVLIASVIIGVHTYMEKKIRESKTEEVLS
jgi:hypothetical protein